MNKYAYWALGVTVLVALIILGFLPENRGLNSILWYVLYAVAGVLALIVVVLATINLIRRGGGGGAGAGSVWGAAKKGWGWLRADGLQVNGAPATPDQIKSEREIRGILVALVPMILLILIALFLVPGGPTFALQHFTVLVALGLLGLVIFHLFFFEPDRKKARGKIKTAAVISVVVIVVFHFLNPHLPDDWTIQDIPEGVAEAAIVVKEKTVEAGEGVAGFLNGTPDSDNSTQSSSTLGVVVAQPVMAPATGWSEPVKVPPGEFGQKLDFSITAGDPANEGTIELKDEGGRTAVIEKYNPKVDERGGLYNILTYHAVRQEEMTLQFRSLEGREVPLVVKWRYYR